MTVQLHERIVYDEDLGFTSWNPRNTQKVDMVLREGHNGLVRVRGFPGCKVGCLNVNPRNGFGRGGFQESHVEPEEFLVGIGVKDVGVVIEDGTYVGGIERRATSKCALCRRSLGRPGFCGGVVDVTSQRVLRVGVNNINGVCILRKETMDVHLIKRTREVVSRKGQTKEQEIQKTNSRPTTRRDVPQDSCLPAL